LKDQESNKEIILEYEAKIKKYDPSYNTPPIDTTSGACYIATSIYGSYDCSEVWVLRRYRDSILAKTWYGKILIQFYYFISPKFITLFGQTKWFKKVWKKILDNFIYKLQIRGLKNTPYTDLNI